MEFDKVMWAHYADNHKEFCIKYKFKKDSFIQIDDMNCSFTRIIPIKYTDENVGIDLTLNTNNSFAMKDICCKYENEVRLLHFEGNSNEKFYGVKLGNSISMDEIIFGYKCSEEVKRTIASLVKGKCKLSEIYNEDGNIYALKKKAYVPS